MILKMVAAASDACQGFCNGNNTGLPKPPATEAGIQPILQLTFAVIGAVALIFVIIGGIKFATSQGDPQSATKARETIIYAIIGLVFALAAETIVTFVLGSI